MTGRPSTHVDEFGRACVKCRKYKEWERFGKRKPYGPAVYQAHLAICKTCDKPRTDRLTAAWQKKLKQAIITAYGGSCACCGETELVFLTIDHMDGGGADHRRELRSKGGTKFYLWLKRSAYPAGFQVLCWNCNAAKHILGVCPH